MPQKYDTSLLQECFSAGDAKLRNIPIPTDQPVLTFLNTSIQSFKRCKTLIENSKDITKLTADLNRIMERLEMELWNETGFMDGHMSSFVIFLAGMKNASGDSASWDSWSKANRVQFKITAEAVVEHLKEVIVKKYKDAERDSGNGSDSDGSYDKVESPINDAGSGISTSSSWEKLNHSAADIESKANSRGRR